MPTADGRFKGIVVPELPWRREKAEKPKARSQSPPLPSNPQHSKESEEREASAVAR